jgi:hypothetical protein
MVHLYTPASEIELLLLKSVFDGAGIRIFVRNEMFGSLAVGPPIEHCNRKSIWVAQADFEDAIALLRDLHRRADLERHVEPEAVYTLRDKLRMLAEFVLFGWFMPGRRPRRHPARRPPLRLIAGSRPPGGPAEADDDDDESPPDRAASGGGPADPPPLRLV